MGKHDLADLADILLTEDSSIIGCKKSRAGPLNQSTWQGVWDLHPAVRKLHDPGDLGNFAICTHTHT